MLSIKRLAILCSLLAVTLYQTQAAFGFFNNQKEIAANTFQTRQLLAPETLNARSQGHTVILDWDAGQNGDGYAVSGAANGSSEDCAGVDWTDVATVTATIMNDEGRFTPQGTFFCYRVQTTLAAWHSTNDNPKTAVRLGFVAASLAVSNDGDHSACSGGGDQVYGETGTLDCGDQIVITFNQAVDPLTGPDGDTTICADPATGMVWLGSTNATGACDTSETTYLGTLSGGTIGEGATRYAASYDWSAGDTTLTVTVGTRIYGSGYSTVSAETWTFTPTPDADRLLDAVDGYHVCDSDAGGGDCLPETAVTEMFRTTSRSAGAVGGISNSNAPRVKGQVRKNGKPKRAVTPTLTPTPQQRVPSGKTKSKQKRMPTPTPTPTVPATSYNDGDPRVVVRYNSF